jgi:cobyrinic acid a,c-diamide synthase
VVTLPRVVVAAPASGHGKTTVATGLMAALRAAGHEVSGHKVGPDYIDPGYHALATGRPGRNLDPRLVGEGLLRPLLLHGARTPRPADVAVVEGVMGLYDGALGRDGYASTAHVATVLRAPVLLVVDASHASRSVAAVVHGMATFDGAVDVAGVVVNKVASDRHRAEVVAAVERTGVPVLGVLGRDDGVAVPSRHLGLVPAAERAGVEASLDRLAALVAQRVDLDAVLRIARGAPDLADTAWDPVQALGGHARPWTSDPAAPTGPVVAVAGGRAFTFRYAETTELLRAAGCRPVVFDPLHDEHLPPGTQGLYLGGGFPEVHAAELAANAPMRAAVAHAVSSGVPTVAECAGLLYLCRTVDGVPMAGALDLDAAMTPRLTLGYRDATAPQETLIAARGETVSGHEFHRTALLSTPQGDAAWTFAGTAGPDAVAEGVSADPAGTGAPTVHASYLHTHWAGHPGAVARFADAVRRTPPLAPSPSVPHRNTARLPGAAAPSSRRVDIEPDLRHHGDREVALGLVDLAVNVHPGPRPDWLERALAEAMGRIDRYPDATAARTALALRHERDAEEVLPTAGGAEAFTLVARLRRWRRPVVVHPQFTEPEAALRDAGHAVDRLVLHAQDGFMLDPARVPEDADLVVVGNPTNPTGALHARATLASLAAPGRVLLVDEAFMDAVPGEPETLTSRRLPGLLVARSLTKTWAIPGLRAGYVVGDPELVAAVARLQPPWSVSTPAAAAMVACGTADAVAEADRRAVRAAEWRDVLVSGLADLGLPVAGEPVTPFVLVRVPEDLRQRLRDRGFAVRRGDTFPGLGAGWVRVAVRDPATTRKLLAAVDACLAAVSDA